MALHFFSHFFSFFFHPSLILTYILLLLVLINPYLFGGHKGAMWLIVDTIYNSFFLPTLAIVMLKALGFIESFEMKTTKERIIPYIISGTFFLWIFWKSNANPAVPKIFTMLVLGATISLFIAFFLNLFFKISIHAVGIAGLLGMLIICTIPIEGLDMTYYTYFTLNLGFVRAINIPVSALLVTSILVCGMVGSSRLFLKAHTPYEIYSGYIVGLFGMFMSVQLSSLLT